MALKLLNAMRKRRIRFYDIGILDELFKRVLAAVALIRGYQLPPSLTDFSRNPGSNGVQRSVQGSEQAGERRCRSEDVPSPPSAHASSLFPLVDTGNEEVVGASDKLSNHFSGSVRSADAPDRDRDDEFESLEERS